MKYAVVIEDAGTNFSAYVPDLPGCIATGRSIEEAENEIRSAIQSHLEGLKKEMPNVDVPCPLMTTKLAILFQLHRAGIVSIDNTGFDFETLSFHKQL